MHIDLLLLQAGGSVQHKQAVERRLKLATRVGQAAAIVALLAMAGYLYQHFQTREARRLLHENRNLAQENQRKAEENRHQLIQMKVASGLRNAEEGELHPALLWFADAMQLVKSDPVQEAAHRIRFQSILRQCPKLTQVFAHQAKVNWCEFSPDGKRLVTGSDDGTARLWNAQTGQPITPPLRHQGKVWIARFTPDGKWLGTASSDGSAQIWDAVSGEPRAPSLRHSGPVNWIAFSPTGDQVVSASDDQTARIWDAVTGKQQAVLRHAGPVKTAEFSPDGRYLLTASADRTARLWEAKTGQPVSQPLLHNAAVNHATFSPDGKWIGTGARLGPRERSSNLGHRDRRSGAGSAETSPCCALCAIQPRRPTSGRRQFRRRTIVELAKKTTRLADRARR